MRRWFIYFIPLVLLTIYSCDLPFGIKLASSYATPTFDSSAATEAMMLTLTAYPTLTPENGTSTPQAGLNGGCAYVWTSQTLPKITEQVKAAFLSAGLKDADPRADAYGESCINTLKNTATAFTTIETDFRIDVKVSTLKDEETMGNFLGSMLDTLLNLPLDSFPGSRTGYVGVRFYDGYTELNLWFPLESGRKAVENGLKGAALLSSLSQ